MITRTWNTHVRTCIPSWHVAYEAICPNMTCGIGQNKVQCRSWVILGEYRDDHGWTGQDLASWVITHEQPMNGPGTCKIIQEVLNVQQYNPLCSSLLFIQEQLILDDCRWQIMDKLYFTHELGDHPWKFMLSVWKYYRVIHLGSCLEWTQHTTISMFGYYPWKIIQDLLCSSMIIHDPVCSSMIIASSWLSWVILAILSNSNVHKWVWR